MAIFIHNKPLKIERAGEGAPTPPPIPPPISQNSEHRNGITLKKAVENVQDTLFQSCRTISDGRNYYCKVDVYKRLDGTFYNVKLTPWLYCEDIGTLPSKFEKYLK